LIFSEDAVLTIQLPADIERRLQNLASATGRTVSFYVQQAVLGHIDDLEDLQMAEQRIADIHAGRTTTVPIEDVMKKHGLSDKIIR
jgi:RHH-type rel operon transcriptional repressor/antitoxin RelB